ncbi:MAG TPA: hypothetical protein VM219_03665, partial [Phycisphaerae bacterium]|nr:hypothetical protein [Phycisphaerae bacterium]
CGIMRHGATKYGNDKRLGAEAAPVKYDIMRHSAAWCGPDVVTTVVTIQNPNSPAGRPDHP